jgi:predicted enzyme related to lactoylglutathione lyase
MASVKKGQFVWYEDMTRDPRGAISFYTDVIGWKTEPFQGTDYTMWVSKQGPLGGVLKHSEEAAKQGAPASWIAHVQVDDVDATVARARQLGGRVYKEPNDIPTVGRLAVIADPQGAALSVFTPSGDMPLHDVSGEGEFCWNELVTSDAAAAFRFYSELFGWKIVEEMDMGPAGTYRIFGVGDRRLGGIMTAPRDRPSTPAWLFYAETGNLDAALRRATTKGAKVLSGPMEVPGGARIAQLQDPQGATFALHESVRR